MTDDGTEHGNVPQASDGPGKTPVRKGQARDRAAEPSREDRLKAALKANMGRRKAQARARASAMDNDNEKE